jgi:hypothetical protein
MNTRCYRCGWSFTLSREAMEAAAVTSAGEKAHAVHCPRCRQAIRIPMDQIMRGLPPGWQPQSEATAEPVPTTAEPDSEAATDEKPEIETAATAPTGRRHRHSGKTSTSDSGKSAAGSAAKISTHQRS